MTIRALSFVDESYFPAALDILNRLQGRNIFPSHYLHDRARDPQSRIVAAFQDDKLVGAAVANILGNFDYYLSFGNQFVEYFRRRRVGTLMTMAIHEDFQGQGLGQKLSRARLAWLKEKNCNTVIGVSWVSGQKHTSDRVFEKLGFRAVARNDLFYEAVSRERGFVCPACGGPPCRCPAILYQLDWD